ncbi:PREDICTED: nucleic-acid-binding protein from mobile element jockey-like [Papilio xuthus]|uniref:Nucleic-acid-binding protein from mobile element jockey-like n=2 Tax=Papilio xuthus TaxID=66420 RepID=A0AAJ7EL17_PAPXU|nr:PREDICTED: nucleic-acid-binding protein from mobile element jockey-like [Papilio xuthus]
MELDSPLSPENPEDTGGTFTEVRNKKKRKKRSSPAPSSAASSASSSPVPPKAPRPHSPLESRSAKSDPIPALMAMPVEPPKTAPIKQSSVRPVPPVARALMDKKPPPIYIQAPDKWPMIQSAMSNKFKVVAAATAQGIRMQLETAEAFRFVTRFLQEKEVYYHTYTLAEERILRVVIKRIPKEIPVEYVAQSLKDQKFPVISVFRMTNRRSKSPIDLVQVHLELSPEGKAIFDVKSICGLSGLIVEPPRKNGLPGQCHKCQLYGHSARNCFARPRCVKCLGDHGTSECSRPKDKSLLEAFGKPACVLCRGDHTANYHGCPKAPKRSPKLPQRSVRRPPAVLSANEFPPLQPSWKTNARTPAWGSNIPTASVPASTTPIPKPAPVKPAAMPTPPKTTGNPFESLNRLTSLNMEEVLTFADEYEKASGNIGTRLYLIKKYKHIVCALEHN